MLNAVNAEWIAIPLDRAIAGASRNVAEALEKVLAGNDLGLEEGLTLAKVEGNDLLALLKVADELRQPRSRRPAILANAYLEGTYSEVYPDKSEDAQGMCKLIKQFSFPGALAVTAPRKRRVPSTKTANRVIAPYS